VQQIFIALK